MLQEELAFVLEMLGLFEEALVQYDELDALFTQFVLNSTVGGKKFLSNLIDSRGVLQKFVCNAIICLVLSDIRNSEMVSIISTTTGVMARSSAYT